MKQKQKQRASTRRYSCGRVILAIGVVLSVAQLLAHIKTTPVSFVGYDISAASNTESEPKDDLEQYFKLAYDESYGVLDGIPNDKWKQAQSWARSFGFHKYAHDPAHLLTKGLGFWFFVNYDPYFACPYSKRIGGLGDGPKWTCNLDRLKDIGQDRWKADVASGKHISINADDGGESPSSTAAAVATAEYDASKYGCLVYSIGSEGNYLFEDAIQAQLGREACEIHVFDYSGNFERKVNAKMNIHFHQWGYKGSKTQDADLPAGKAHMFTDLFEIIKRLGHQDRVIDLFKIDCEGCEYVSYEDFTKYEKIRQILIEVHAPPGFDNGKEGEVVKDIKDSEVLKAQTESPTRRETKVLVNFFDSFAQNNLIMFSKEPNPWCRGSCLEYSFIRLKPSFLNPN